MDFEKVSKQTNSFCFRLRRVFSIRWGLLLGEELSNGKAKNIYIAMKYVYMIYYPESFSLHLPDFTAFYPVKPKHVGNAKIPTLLPIKLTLMEAVKLKQELQVVP